MSSAILCSLAVSAKCRRLSPLWFLWRRRAVNQRMLRRWRWWRRGRGRYRGPAGSHSLRSRVPLHAHGLGRYGRSGHHHHPALQAVHDVCAQLLKACNFGGDIVGLYIQVHAALVINALNLHNGFVWRGLQHPIIAATAPMVESTGNDACMPEAGRLVHVEVLQSIRRAQRRERCMSCLMVRFGRSWCLVVARGYLRGQSWRGMHPGQAGRRHHCAHVALRSGVERPSLSLIKWQRVIIDLRLCRYRLGSALDRPVWHDRSGMQTRHGRRHPPGLADLGGTHSSSLAVSSPRDLHPAHSLDARSMS